VNALSAQNTAVVTGAGSGVGRAVVCELAREGWRVALVGRRPEPLVETKALAGAGNPGLLVWPCDIGDPTAVEQMGQGVMEAMGGVQLLVNAAGTNVPQRSLEILSLADYETIVNTNLHGAYHCVQVLLPQMRARGAGTIVNVVSDAGKQASPKAGAAYVMSKFGMAGLTQSINAEERSRGIRACSIFPGDIDTPLLDKRPAPPDAAARGRMLRPEDVAECVMFCVRMPAHAIVEELTVRPA
jgi:NAD(P)-dependent dehydrogenase (short-subunit alcohol dehydrogenase family)